MTLKRKDMAFYSLISLVSAAAFLLFASPPALRPAQGAAPGTGNASKGKAIFENQCSTCHTIGGGRETGPDLKGVTEQRPHEWLVRFITDPEKMFKEKDPTAEKLLKEYAGVRMPNMGLSDQQANDVLAYIKTQSK